jgi:hypothetical protein
MGTPSEMGILSIAKLAAPGILPYALGAAFLLGALPAGYAGWKLRDIGYQHHLKAELKAALAATTKARQQEATSAAITDSTRQHLDTQKAAQEASTRTLIERVPYYVHNRQLPPQGGHCSGQPQQGSPLSLPSNALARSDPNPDTLPDGSVSLGFVRLHNYAASGSSPPLSEPPGFDPDAPSGVGMPALSGTLIRNYGVCYGYRAEVEAWREWYAAQAALWAQQEKGK